MVQNLVPRMELVSAPDQVTGFKETKGKAKVLAVVSRMVRVNA
jgi:hypothetical protein